MTKDDLFHQRGQPSNFFITLSCGPASKPVSIDEFVELEFLVKKFGMSISVCIGGVSVFATENRPAIDMYRCWIAGWERELGYEVPPNSPIHKVRMWWESL